MMLMAMQTVCKCMARRSISLVNVCFSTHLLAHLLAHHLPPSVGWYDQKSISLAGPHHAGSTVCLPQPLSGDACTRDVSPPGLSCKWSLHWRSQSCSLLLCVKCIGVKLLHYTPYSARMSPENTHKLYGGFNTTRYTLVHGFCFFLAVSYRVYRVTC